MSRYTKAVRATALKIVGLYAALGYAWLVMFDAGMDAADLRGIEPYTDFIFLAVSSSALFFVLLKFIGQHDQAQRALDERVELAERARQEQEHNISLRAVNAELERSNAELEQFAYVASHDLRQPCRIVNSYLSLTERRLDDVLDEESREYIAFAREGAKRMDHLIVDLLEYSRAGRGKDAPEAVDLNAVVEDVIATLGLEIDAAGGRVVVSDPMPTVVATWFEMRQIFQNLIANALKYRHPDRPPEITVTARRNGDAWEIGVMDNGIGIAAEHYDRIFRIFQRLHDDRAFEGTGIGLAIVKKVVERRGGRIMVRSSSGEGSEFVVSFPIEGLEAIGDRQAQPLRA